MVFSTYLRGSISILIMMYLGICIYMYIYSRNFVPFYKSILFLVGAVRCRKFFIFLNSIWPKRYFEIGFIYWFALSNFTFLTQLRCWGEVNSKCACVWASVCVICVIGHSSIHMYCTFVSMQIKLLEFGVVFFCFFSH